MSSYVIHHFARTDALMGIWAGISAIPFIRIEWGGSPLGNPGCQYEIESVCTIPGS